jgi:hypothetical protein
MNVLANRPLWTMPKEERLLLSELSELGIDSDEEIAELEALQRTGDAEIAILKASHVGVVDATTTGLSSSGDVAGRAARAFARTCGSSGDLDLASLRGTCGSSTNPGLGSRRDTFG